MAFEMTLRAMKSRRSNASSSSMPLPLPMKTWQMQRLGRLHALAEIARIDRHVAPAEQHAGPRPRSPSSTISSTMPETFPIARHEQVADAVLAGLRAARCRASRIPRRRSRAGSAPACRSRRPSSGRRRRRRDGRGSAGSQALLDDRVRLAVLHVGDEADAAGILLVGGIVEALRRRQAGSRAGWRDGAAGRLASSRQIAHPALAQRLAARRRCMFSCRRPGRTFRTGRTRFVASRGSGVSSRARTSRASPGWSAAQRPFRPRVAGDLERISFRSSPDETSRIPEGRTAPRMGQHHCPNRINLPEL